MSRRPRRTRRDACQRSLVLDLVKLGAVVFDLADVGGRTLDLLVCWRCRCLPVEAKRPGGRLTAGQERAVAELRAVGVEAIVAATAEEVAERWPSNL